MTVVLVHGNPATSAVWDQLSERLGEAGYLDQRRLSPPGFGAAMPTGFDATVGGYRDWLVDELEQIEGAVDLVGQDWGGGHVVNVAMTRPDLIRSWCSDAIGVFDPDYVWHDLAQIWQRRGDGEHWVADQLAQGEQARAEWLVSRGLDPRVAASIAEGFDEEMGACILTLYRSATQPVMAELGAELEAAQGSPGLAIVASADHVVGTNEQRQRSALRAGARVQVLEDMGHWWMTEAGGRAVAEVLTAFWSSL